MSVVENESVKVTLPDFKAESVRVVRVVVRFDEWFWKERVILLSDPDVSVDELLKIITTPGCGLLNWEQDEDDGGQIRVGRGQKSKVIATWSTGTSNDRKTATSVELVAPGDDCLSRIATYPVQM